MPAIQFELQRLSRAREFFIPGDSNDTLVISLEGLRAELRNRVGAIRGSQELITSIAHASALSDAISYASGRLSDVMARHQQIGWMRRTLAYEPKPNVFDQAADTQAALWRIFLGLAIKDYHLDISSLMDAVAPVVIQVDNKRKSGDKIHPPGWNALLPGTKGNYREQLSTDITNIIDRAEKRWWKVIKEIRNIVTHREHDRIVFGNPKDGLLFQVYDQKRTPKILLPQVLYQNAHNIVDFDLYSAWVIAEVITLLDDLGISISLKMQIPQAIFSHMSFRMVDKSVAQSIERLIQLVDAP